MRGKNKKPAMNWLKIAESIVVILAGLADIGFVIYQIVVG